jgi:hypothetical protein
MLNSLIRRAWLAPALACLILAGCQKEDLQTPEAQDGLTATAREKLAAELNHWQALAYDHTQLYQTVKDLPVGAEKYVELPNPEGKAPQKAMIRRNEVVTPENQTVEDAALGIVTLDGELTEGQTTFTLTLSPEWLSMTVFEPTGLKRIESAAKYDPQIKGTLVEYQEGDLKNPPTDAQCAMETQAEQAFPPTAFSGKTTQDCWQIAVLCHGDYSYYLQSGSNVNTAKFFMAAAINDASAIFRPINIHLVAKYLIQNTTNENLSSEIGTLVNQVTWIDNTQYGSYDRDLNLYFSGKNLHSNGDYGAAGRVHNDGIGSLCARPTVAYGVAETILGTYNLRVQAHELGHLLGAYHDSNCSYGLMYPYYNHSCASNVLSTQSKNYINTHLWYNHGCTYMAAGC